MGTSEGAGGAAAEKQTASTSAIAEGQETQTPKDERSGRSGAGEEGSDPSVTEEEGDWAAAGKVVPLANARD